MDSKLDKGKLIEYWVDTSDKDFKTMLHLLNSRDYHWALFIGHLVIEKLIKGCIVKETKAHAPFSHDLQYLAKISKIEFPEEYLDYLAMITTFNLNTRYDNYKQEFYKKCTREFAECWIKIIKELRLWIKQKLSE